MGSGWSLPSLTDLNMGEEGTHHFGQQTRVSFSRLCVLSLQVSILTKYLSLHILTMFVYKYDNIDISIAQLQEDTVQ